MSLPEYKIDYRRILHRELWGILFIVVFGALLHFTFELSGRWLPMGVISAVNESVWEHLKLAFYPSLIFTLIIYFKPGRHPSGFLFASLSTLSRYFPGPRKRRLWHWNIASVSRCISGI